MVLRTRFNQFVSQNLLADESDLILVAVSGGKDSILLLHLLLEAGFRLGVAHCNFNLRGTESDEEEVFVRTHCQELGVPFYSKSFYPQEYAQQNQVSVQMACRDLRYAWFRDLASEQGYTKVATAHHANDQVETFILNLLRGTGVDGLRGIPVKRDLFIRPLLFLTRGEVDHAVAEYQLEYRDDSSNLNVKYSRNKIRYQVIPPLKELNPQLESTLLQTMEIFGELSIFLKSSVKSWKQTYFIFEKEGIQIPIDELLLLQPRKLLIFELFREYGFSPTVSQDLVFFLDRYEKTADVLSGLRFDSTTHELFYDRKWLFLKEKSDRQGNSVRADQLSVTQRDLQKPVSWKNHLISFRPAFADQEHESIVYFQVDRDKLLWPLQIRSWQSGDSFKPLGMGGRRKKLSDLLVSKKIPNWRKFEIPILVNGDGEIIWVMGLQGSETFKISRNTKNVMAISYFCEYGE